MSDTFIVTATPPTPNGDFHVGHFSGPYLGGDIFSRYQRMKGNKAVYVSSADHHQSYVVTTAERLGVDADTLSKGSHSDMIRTLEAGDIAFDAFNSVNADHNALVQDFFLQIEARGFVTRKTKQMPWSVAEGRFLFESFVSGYCAECWSPTAGAICEACGHPNDASTLDLLRPKGGTGEVEFRELEIAVLELERFRPQFEEYYASKRGKWRPHLIELVDELMAGPLPDYPLTYPSDWGIPAPFAGLDGQVLNVWAEMLPGLINSTSLATEGGLWAKDSGSRLVQFLGYDNSFFFAFIHPAMAWAHGDCILPDTIITNEFFELENFKFSTSKGHLIWARDLLAERDVSAVRFYLALANPETQKMNFTRDAMDKLVEVRFVTPFQEMIDTIASVGSKFGMLGTPLALSEQEAARINRVLARFARFYEVEQFSPQRVAEHLSQLLVRMTAGVGNAKNTDDPAELRFAVATLIRVLPIVTAPLMPGLADALATALGVGGQKWSEVTPGDHVAIDALALQRARAVVEFSTQNQARRAS